MTPSSNYRRLACLSPLFRDQWEKLGERHMGIEPILSAWKAEVLAIIRMAQVWLSIEPTVIIYHILYLKLFWLLFHEVNILVYVYSYYVYDNTNSNNIHLLRKPRDASNIL